MRAKGVCCGFVEPVHERILDLHGSHQVWSLDRGILPLLVAYWYTFMPNSNFLLSFSTLCVAVSMSLTFWATHLVNRSSFCWLSVGLLPVIPAVAYASRRWDVYIPQLIPILLGFIFFIHSRRLSKSIWVFLFLVVFCLSAFWSSRETDNLLLLLCLASFSIGGTLWGLYTGKDHQGKIISRKRVVLHCGIALLVGFSVYRRMHFSSLGGADYYLDELDHNAGKAQADPSSLTQRLAYVSYLIDRGVGPWISWIFIWIMPFIIWKRTVAIEIIFAVAIPLFLLSWIAKKNHYYIATIWPFLPIIAAVGLRSMPRLLAFPMGIWVLALGWFPYLAKSNPDGITAMKMGHRPWVRGTSDYYGLLQTADGNLDIRPES